MAFAIRFGNFQPFADVTSRDDERTNGFSIGLVTYDQHDDLPETYRVSSVELAGRSDHLSDAITSLSGDDVALLSTDAPILGDKDLLRKEEVKPAKSKSDKPAAVTPIKQEAAA